MAFYPLYIDIEAKTCIVVGGGAVAERKVLSLLECGADVTVISPEVTDRLDALAQQGRLRLEKRPYAGGDLADATLAFVATSDAECNRLARLEAIENNIPVNVADKPESGTFIVPSTIRRGPLVISISTSGKCPALARAIRADLEGRYSDEYALVCDVLHDVRGSLVDIYDEPEQRTAALDRIIKSDVIDLIVNGQLDEAKEHIRSCI